MLGTNEYIEKCIDYILENDKEKEDFEINPSNNHVYYYAMIIKYGKKYADNEYLSIYIRENK